MQNFHGPIRRHIIAAITRQAFKAEARGALPGGFRPGADHFAGLTTANVHHRLRREIKCQARQSLIHATLEPRACIGAHLMASAGKRNAHGIENRTFDETFGGGFITARRLTTDDAAKRFRPGFIGDDAIFRGQFISLAIQRQKAFAFARHAHGERFALHLCGVENMQGAAKAIGE